MEHFRRSFKPLSSITRDLDYKFVTPDRYKDIMHHLRNICSRTDPLNRTFCDCLRKGGNEFIEFMTYKTLNENLSLIAVNDKDNVVGVALNGIASQNDWKELKPCIDNITEPNLKYLLSLQQEQNTHKNIFEHFKTNNAFEIRLLSVDNQSYNGRLIGRQLVRYSETMARYKSQKLLKMDATGNFSQQVLSFCGFKCWSEKYYNQYNEEEDATPVISATMSHPKYQLLYKLLL